MLCGQLCAGARGGVFGGMLARVLRYYTRLASLVCHESFPRGAFVTPPWERASSRETQGEAHPGLAWVNVWTIFYIACGFLMLAFYCSITDSERKVLVKAKGFTPVAHM
jgi:hypothetical protein